MDILLDYTKYFPDWIFLLFGILLSFTISFSTIPSIIELAKSKGFFDIPNIRASHNNATPYLGGVAVFAGFALTSVIIVGKGFEHELLYIIIALIFILYKGLKDDIMNIIPAKKLKSQILASILIVIFGDIRLVNLFGIFGIEELSYFASVGLSIFVFLVVVNGFNLIDGINGLTSGVGILASAILGVWYFITGFINYSILSISLLGALIAFFYFNVYGVKNKIFLGDSGSLFIGFTIAILIVQFLNYQVLTTEYKIQAAPALAFGILIIPLYDTLRIIVLRISQKRSPFSADRQHIHHILIDLGFSHKKATFILLSINIFFITLSIVFQKLKNLELISLQLILALILTFISVQILNKKKQKWYARKQCHTTMVTNTSLHEYN